MWTDGWESHLQALSGAVMGFLAAFGAVYALVVMDMRRRFAGHAEYAALRQQHSELAQTVGQISMRLSQMPTHADFSGLSQQMAVLGANMLGLSESIGQVAHMTDLLVRERMREGAPEA